jgi:hypothetical protein
MSKKKRSRWSRKGKPREPQRCSVCNKMVPADECGYFKRLHPRCSRARDKARGIKRKPMLPPSTSVRPVAQAGLPSLGKKRR